MAGGAAVPRCLEEGRRHRAGDLQRRQRGAGLRRRTAEARRPQLAEARIMVLNDNRRIIAVADPVALAKAAAERLLARIADNSDRAAICLTGGSSPKQIYELLGKEP